MYFSKVLAIIALATTALATRVTYDVKYDDANARLDSVACSDGPNGLMTRYGWQTQGQVIGFPFIGGAEAVDHWNSPYCGTCWEVTWNGTRIHIVAIDHTGQGLNLAFDALNALTNGNAKFLGQIDAVVEMVDKKYCDL